MWQELARCSLIPFILPKNIGVLYLTFLWLYWDPNVTCFWTEMIYVKSTPSLFTCQLAKHKGVNSLEKDPNGGKDWGKEEKGMTEDEMVGWHHWTDGHELEQAPGDGEGQGNLERCSRWGHKESDTTEQLNNKNKRSSRHQWGPNRYHRCYMVSRLSR